MTSASTGMSEFKDVMADFGQLSSLALKGVVTAPLIDLWLRLGPPPAKSMAILTSLFEFVVVVWGFHFWSSIDIQKLNKRMKIALCIFCVGLISSLFLMSMFTVSPGVGRDRVIEGWAVRTDVKPVLNTSYSSEQALRDGEFDPTAVWTATSVATMRILITVVWLVTFAALAGYLTTFIMLERRRSS